MLGMWQHRRDEGHVQQDVLVCCGLAIHVGIGGLLSFVLNVGSSDGHGNM